MLLFPAKHTTDDSICGAYLCFHYFHPELEHNLFKLLDAKKADENLSYYTNDVSSVLT